MLQHLIKALVVVLVASVVLQDKADSTQLAYIGLASMFGFMLVECVMRLSGRVEGAENTSVWEFEAKPNVAFKDASRLKLFGGKSNKECKQLC